MGTGIEPTRYRAATLMVTEADAGLGPSRTEKPAGSTEPKETQWALNAGAPPKAVQPEFEVAVGAKTFSKAQLKAAVKTGLGKVASIVATRTRALKLPVVWGPNFGDATYLFRIGQQLNGKSASVVVLDDAYGFDANQMARAKSIWEERGFPLPSREELAAMQVVNLHTRLEARPDILWVPKHYPGGNHFLEVTERNAVSFADAPEATAGWVGQWDSIFRMKTPPKAIMLAHAQYAPESFGFSSDAGFTSRLLNRRFAFKDLPASLNPLLIAHLHGVQNYQGLTVGDWYNMGAIRQFASEIELAPAKGEFVEQDAVVMMLALEADVDMVGGQETPSAELAAYLQSLPNFADIDAALTSSLQRTSARLKAIGRPGFTPEDIAQMPFADRLQLKSKPQGALGESDSNVKPLFEGAKDIWNRQGLLTLMQRVAMIETLSGRSISKPPVDIANEEAWAKGVLSNPTFKAFNSKIPWDSPPMKALFEESFQVTAAALSSQR